MKFEKQNIIIGTSYQPAGEWTFGYCLKSIEEEP